MDNFCVDCMECRNFKISAYCNDCYENLKDYYDKNEKIKRNKQKRKEYDRKYYLEKKIIKKQNNIKENNCEFISILKGKFILEI
jgi:hypothetical protein